MIIGIDISRANHTNRTGVEWYAFYLLQELKQIVPNTIRVRLYTDAPLLPELAEGLPSHFEVRVLRWPPRRLWTQVRLSWEMLLHAPDVLFVPAHVFPYIHPRKTVMTVHDLAAIRFPETYNWFERWYTVWSAKAAAKKLWQVITPSQFTKEELLKVGGSGQNVSVVPLAFDERFKIKDLRLKAEDTRYLPAGRHDKIQDTNKEDLNSKFQILNSSLPVDTSRLGITKPYLLFIGRLEEKKNVARVVEAFGVIRQAHDLQLVLVGIPGYGYEKIKQAIDASEYKQDILLPGYVDKDVLPAVMQQARVFMFTSLLEGFGIPVLEALAAGAPVVTSNNSSLPEVGGDAAIYVNPVDVTSIADGIEKILSDESLRSSLREKGFAQVQKFSWRRTAEETLRVLLK